MRTIRTVLAAAAVLSLAALATAQETWDPSSYDWQRRANDRDVSRNFPRAAREGGRSGVAGLCCTVNEDATLHCDIAFEHPADQGYGQAALNVAQSYRVKQEDVERFRSSNARLPLPVTFLQSGLLEADRMRAREGALRQTVALCASAPASTPR